MGVRLLNAVATLFEKHKYTKATKGTLPWLALGVGYTMVLDDDETQ